jgi:cytoskeletal protein CcmA (bactofilin family)
MYGRGVRRLVIGCIFVVVLAFAGPATAKSGDDSVVITGPVTIGPGQTAGDVVVAHGDVRVAEKGRISGDLVVASGTVRIFGEVNGDVVTIADRALLGPRAHVGGDLSYADKKPVLQSGARVDGDVKRVDVDKATGGLGVAVGIGLWIAFTVSMLVLGAVLLALFPRAAEVVYDIAQSRTGAAFLWGLLTFIAIPIVGLILLVTVIGLPLGLLLLLLVAPLYAAGYIAAAYGLGQRILGPERGRFLAFLAGLGILRVLAIVPILGGIVGFLATLFGLGLLVLAVARSRGRPAQPAQPAPVPAA